VSQFDATSVDGAKKSVEFRSRWSSEVGRVEEVVGRGGKKVVEKKKKHRGVGWGCRRRMVVISADDQ
jgi:hypothetical protein